MATPNSPLLPWTAGENRLMEVFQDVTNSYKFFWLLGLLEVVGRRQDYVHPIEEVAAEMIVRAWHPHHYFHLNFGVQDQLAAQITAIQSAEGLEEDIAIDTLRRRLLAPDRHVVTTKALRLVSNYVPTRFLRPWFRQELRGKKDQEVDEAIRRLSADRSAGRRGLEVAPPYFFPEGSRTSLRVDATWRAYLMEHLGLLRDYTHWHLARYLQARNPNVPNVLSKLEFNPAERDQATARKLWLPYLRDHRDTRCIYSGAELEGFAIDHFLPWSFVAHNHVWNTVPIPPSVNSAKGNRLPSAAHLDRYLHLQHSFYHHLQGQSGKIATIQRQNYTLLFQRDDANLLSLSEEAFMALLRQQVEPLIAVARSQGFGEWVG